MAQTSEMDTVAQRLLDPTVKEFDVVLLDRVVAAAYDPTSPHRAAANKALMTLQEAPDLWTKADAILERSANPQTRFFGLQVLDDAIRVRCVASRRAAPLFMCLYALQVIH